MTLNEYQEAAMTTCLPSCENFSYMMLNLVGEVGEFAGKVAKAVRKQQATISGNQLGTLIASDIDVELFEEELTSEAGDILWQLSGLCKVCGLTLEEVAQANLDKLAARKAEGTLISHKDH